MQAFPVARLPVRGPLFLRPHRAFAGVNFAWRGICTLAKACSMQPLAHPPTHSGPSRPQSTLPPAPLGTWPYRPSEIEKSKAHEGLLEPSCPLKTHAVYEKPPFWRLCALCVRILLLHKPIRVHPACITRSDKPAAPKRAASGKGVRLTSLDEPRPLTQDGSCSGDPVGLGHGQTASPSDRAACSRV